MIKLIKTQSFLGLEIAVDAWQEKMKTLWEGFAVLSTCLAVEGHEYIIAITYKAGLKVIIS